MKMPRRLLPLPPLLLAFGLLLLAGCGRSNTAGGRGQTQAIPVQAGVVSRQTLPIYQSSVGTVQAERSVAVKSQVDGVIRDINFSEGGPVKAGDLLVTLDQRPFENALKIARANLANARAEADRAESDAARYKQLEQTQNVSVETYLQFATKRDTSRAQVMAAEAAVANAELQLSYASIHAPISGVAGELAYHEGSLIKANDSTNSLVTVNQISPIEVAYAVPEKVLPLVRRAAAAGPVAVRISRQSGGTESLEGRLSFIDNTVDTTTGTVLLKAEFPNEDASLWPGEFVQVATQLGFDKDVLVVPAGTIQVGQQGSQAFVINADSTVEVRQVKAGRNADSVTIVLDGLKEGERVVTDGHLRLTPKARVVIRTLEEAAAGAASPKSRKK
jgi:multidrug efflux system membrane fusion protein